jgi:cobalt-zinc-cadmium efflux system membrane fusion protein
LTHGGPFSFGFAEVFVIRNIGRRARAYMVVGVLGACVALGIGALWYVRSPHHRPHHDAEPNTTAAPSETVEADEPGIPATIHFPKASWSAASLAIEPVRSGQLERSLRLTGKVALNEDRIAHVFPLVEGRVYEVKVRLGDRVKKGDLLVVVQSKEVGQAKLRLYQDRLAHEIARTKDGWTQAVASNAQTMVRLMGESAPIETIEKELKDKPVGEYRDRLMSAYIARYRAEKQMERLAPLSRDGSVTGKQLVEAEADLNAAKATLESLLEQIRQDARQAAAVSAQTVKELATRVAVDETDLKILGFEPAELAELDPTTQGEAVSHYPVRAPFDGTVLSKDVALLERVGPDHQILSVADLSTVWITADLYEEHLAKLEQLDGRTIYVAAKARPEQKFEARVFYAGDVVDETTRTISLRAAAENRSGLLKPGMFVDVEIPASAERPVVRIPLSAVQEYEGRSFVFVHTGGDTFDRRDVELGPRNAEAVEIRAGLKPDERVVTAGGFFLKSRMLASLLEE